MTTIVKKTRVCDRCKSQKFEPTYGVIHSYLIACKSMQGDWVGSNSPSIDLCTHCVDQFKDWLDYYNLGKDVEHDYE